MRPTEVVRRAADYLERHGVEGPAANAERLLLHVLRTDRAGLYARTEGLDAREARAFGRALCQRCAGTPLQHLTGEQAFRRLRLEVRPGVFVPRPETEVLVEHALRSLEGEDPVVVDVGTGTGAIALAIKDERPDANVYAIDVSSDAVALARENAHRLGLDVRVLEGPMFEPLPEQLRGWVDLVVSNPPYVTPEEYLDLPAEVRADPEAALLGGVDVIERLAVEAGRWLRDGGALAVEIGARQGDAVASALSKGYADVRVEPDLTGRDRIVLARRP
ncbi:MAG TPA: peptide chain release factor N(5)-glutamine methyltransferase [Actinomycetota bacterium]